MTSDGHEYGDTSLAPGVFADAAREERERRANERYAQWSPPPLDTWQVPYPTGSFACFVDDLASRGRLTPQDAETWTGLWPRLVVGEESRMRITLSFIGLRSRADLARAVARHVGPDVDWRTTKRPARRRALRDIARSIGAWRPERRIIRSMGLRELTEARQEVATSGAEAASLFAGDDMPAPVNEYLRGETERWRGVAREPARRHGPSRMRGRVVQPRRAPRRTVARRTSARRASAPTRGPPSDSGDSDPAGDPGPPVRQGTAGGREGEGQGGGHDLDRVGALRRAGREAGIPHASDWLARLAERWFTLACAAWRRVRALARRRIARAGRRPSTGWGRA